MKEDMMVKMDKGTERSDKEMLNDKLPKMKKGKKKIRSISDLRDAAKMAKMGKY
jgi:hypothetical protein